jgi:predicted transcriptional regulator
MTATAIKQPLTSLQQELLELYAHHTSDTELHDIKRMLANYFAQKAMDEMDEIWEEKGYSEETMKEWVNGHERISSNSNL